MNTGTSTRREREREAHRQQIMDVAEEIFGARGYADVTIEDIATKAGFSVGSIYNFFGGKQDLFDQVMLRIAQSRIDDLEQRVFPLADKPWEALRLLCALWVEHHERHRVFLHVAFGSRMSGGSEKLKREPNDVGFRLGQEYLRRAVEFFSRIVDSGEIRHDLSAEECVHIFEGVGRSMLFHAGAGKNSAIRISRPIDAALFSLIEKLFRK